MWQNIIMPIKPFGFLTQKKVKVDQKENNAYKELQDAQNAWRYDIQCMKSPTKIEKIRSRTKRAKP